MKKARPQASGFALVVLAGFLATGLTGCKPKSEPPPGISAHYDDPTFRLRSELSTTTTDFFTDGVDYCLAVDMSRKVYYKQGDDPSSPDDTSRWVYPVVYKPCAALSSTYPGTWSLTRDRNLKVQVGSTTLCLTIRKPPQRLIWNYVQTMGLQYLKDQYYYTGAGGALSLDYLLSSPPIVAGQCGEWDGQDAWHYDPLSHTVSTFYGRCVTGAWSNQVPSGQANIRDGYPVVAFWCDGAAPSPANIPAHQRFVAEGGNSNVQIAHYDPSVDSTFSGKAGLPVVGPLGKCLTYDSRNLTWDTNLSDCDNRIEQNFFYEPGTHAFLTTDKHCLSRDEQGNVTIATCTGADGQKWDYTRVAPDPSLQWKQLDVFAEIRPSGHSDLCLGVDASEDDPFKTPFRNRIRLKVQSCSAVATRLESWFHAVAVDTVRVHAFLVADDDGSRKTDVTPDQIRAIVQAANEQYRRAGMRFLFDPSLDVTIVKSTSINRIGAGAVFNDTLQAFWDASTKAAVQDGYGKMSLFFTKGGLTGYTPPGSAKSACDTFFGSWDAPGFDRAQYLASTCGAGTGVEKTAACADQVAAKVFGSAWTDNRDYTLLSKDLECDSHGYNCNTDVDGFMRGVMCSWGGGWSDSCPTSKDPSEMVYPVLGNTCGSEYRNYPTDKDGYPAITYFTWLGIADPLNFVHETGHYFGLPHTFYGNGDAFNDTPDDPSASPWTDDKKVDACGNINTLADSTPDRRNTMNYFTCALPRTWRSFSPMQLGMISYVLHNYRNRTPMIGCQPAGLYNGDVLHCKDADSYARCQQAATKFPYLECRQ